MDEEKVTLWKQRMTSFQSSGLSIKKWCRENHIAPPAFYYCNNPEVIDTLLPWSKELPDICHLSYNRKKHV